MVSDIGGLNDLSDPPYVVQQTGLLLNSNSQMYVEMRNTAGDNKSNPKDKALVFAERSSKRAGKGKRKADTTPQTNQQHPGVEEGGEFQEGQAQASNRLEALFLEQVETSLRNNNGAYKQGEWERKPWDVRPYTEVIRQLTCRGLMISSCSVPRRIVAHRLPQRPMKSVSVSSIPLRGHPQVSEYRLPSDVPEPDASIIMSKLDTRLPDNWLSEETQTTLKVLLQALRLPICHCTLEANTLLSHSKQPPPRP